MEIMLEVQNKEKFMMNSKTLALAVVFFDAFLSWIKEESCTSCVAVFYEDNFIKILLYSLFIT